MKSKLLFSPHNAAAVSVAEIVGEMWIIYDGREPKRFHEVDLLTEKTNQAM